MNCAANSFRLAVRANLPIERQLMHVSKRPGVHQPMLNGDLQKQPIGVAGLVIRAGLPAPRPVFGAPRQCNL